MKSIIKFFTLTTVLLLSACELDYINPNGPSDAIVLTTREGMITHSIGLKQYYSTDALQSLILTPGTTAREIKGITTFTNILEIEAGGTNLPTFNGNVLGLWLRMLRVMGMAENLIKNAPTVLASDPATLSGVLAHAHLFKAMAIGGLATGFEQFPIQTDPNGRATFVPRAQGLTEAVRLLDEAAALLGRTPPSAEFNTRVLGTNFDLLNTINAYRARYNLMLGRNAEALAAANLVNLNATRSQFNYNNQSPNPVFQQVLVARNYAPRANFGLPTGLFDPADRRIDFFMFTPDITVGGELLKTLRGFFDAIDKPIPVYTADEVRLMRAEAILRTGGNVNDAVNLINEVRTQTTGDAFGVHAGLPAYSGSTTVNDLLLEVYRQRCAELFMSGVRMEDSRRFGRPAPPTNLNPVPLTFERSRNFYPYPDQERLTNPNTPPDPAI